MVPAEAMVGSVGFAGSVGLAAAFFRLSLPVCFKQSTVIIIFPVVGLNRSPTFTNEREQKLAVIYRGYRARGDNGCSSVI